MNFPERSKLRKEASDKRQEERRKLTPTQQLQELDKRLGKGNGAKKERSKLEGLEN